MISTDPGLVEYWRVRAVAAETRESWKTRERDNLRDTALDFGQALELLKAGKLIARDGWNGKGMLIRLHSPTFSAERPYINMKTADAHYVPWTASQTDILAEDWRVVG